MRVPVQKQAMWWGVAVAALFGAMWLLGSAITPFIIGAAIAYILDPVADFLERRGLSRTMAVVVITLGAVLAFVAALLLIVPALIEQLTGLVTAAPEILARLPAFLAERFPDIVTSESQINETLANIGRAIQERGGMLAQQLLGSVMSIIGVLVLLVIVPVVAFYLLLDWDNMIARIDALLPREHAPTIRRLASEIDDALAGFLRGEGTVILILAVYYSIALLLVGLPYSLLVAVITASLSFIPYVGAVIGGVTSIGLALFAFWGDWVQIGMVVGVFVIGQIMEGNFLVPKLVGGHVGLHPVWLLLALSVFGSLFGFAGMLVAVPVAAALGVLVRFAAERYTKSAVYTGRDVPPPPAQPTLIEIVPHGTVATTRREAALAADRRQAQLEIEQMLDDARARHED